MKYEVVTLEKKIVVGVSAITANDAPDVGQTIGGLWGRLYQDKVVDTIKNIKNSFAIGLYSDYTSDNKFCVTVGKEVSQAENNELTVKMIPAGKYAKFSIHGNMVTAVTQAWNEIWSMDLDRSFTGDFEEYLNDDFDNADINIYIALK